MSFSENFLHEEDFHFTHRASQNLWSRPHRRFHLTDRVALCLTVHPKGFSSGAIIMPWDLVPEVYQGILSHLCSAEEGEEAPGGQGP